MAPKSDAKTGEAATAKAKKATKSPFKAKAMSPKAKPTKRAAKVKSTVIENSVTDVAEDNVNKSPKATNRGGGDTKVMSGIANKTIAKTTATKRAPTGAKKGAKTVAKKAKAAKSGSPQRARSASPKKTDSADDGQQNGEEVTASGGESPKKSPKKATKKAPKKATKSSTKAKSSAAIAFEDSVPDDSDDNNDDNNDDSDRDMTWKPERRKQSLVSNNKSANSDESDSDVECDDYESGEESDNDLPAEPMPSTSTSAVTAPKQKRKRVLTEAQRERKRRYDSLRHQRLENRFVCSECGRGFKLSGGLTEHMRTHSGERPFPCNWPNCHKTFNRKAILKTHVELIHKKKKVRKVYKNKRAVYGPGVKEMLGIKKTEEVFECVVEGCDKTFGNKYNLISHQMNKHSNHIKIDDISKPAYRCSLCPAKVTTKRLFETIEEMKRHHFKDHFTPKIKIEVTEEMKVQRDQEMAQFDAQRAALQKIAIDAYRRFQAEPSDDSSDDSSDD